MECQICTSKAVPFFKHKLLNKYIVQYYRCRNCGCVFTEKPYWLPEAYSDSQGIANLDTGVMQRNISFCKKANALLCCCFPRAEVFVDLSGGYGIFTRLMRDLGYNYTWTDKYTENLLARGFEYTGGRCSFATSFEVAEHLDEPMKTFGEWLGMTDNLLFSTVLLEEGGIKKDGSANRKWWYYAYEQGQHIIFYDKKTIQYIADYFGFNYVRFSKLHLLTKRKTKESGLFLAKNFLFQEFMYYLKLMGNGAKKDHEYIKKMMEGNTQEH